MTQRFIYVHFIGTLLLVGGTSSSATTTSPPTASSLLLLPKVVGGTEAPYRIFNFLANTGWDGGTACGGSVIHPQWIMTAAHCKPYVGQQWNWNRFDMSNANEAGAETGSCTEIFTHPAYSNDNNEYNDVALCRLDRMATVQPIQLPTVSQDITLTVGGQELIIAGWGRTVDSSTAPLAAKLRWAQVPIVPNPVCADASHLGPFFQVRAQQMCAGNAAGGVDTCQGDSGGPLFLATSLTSGIALGITSTGVGCGLPNYPGVYTRVASMLPFIFTYVPELNSTRGGSAAPTPSPSSPPTLTPTPMGTCRGYCGGQGLGGCLCDVYCSARGDCCPDYSQTCQVLGTAPPTPPPAVQGLSCRGYCGYVRSNGFEVCSCTTDCFYSGNCCPDLASACGYTTPTLPPSTAPPTPIGATSCAGRCGALSSTGSCGCDSNCGSRQDCCRDFPLQCSSPTPPPSPLATCRGSCGYLVRTNGQSCSCQRNCGDTRSCCVDVTSVCGYASAPTPPASSPTPQPTPPPTVPLNIPPRRVPTSPPTPPLTPPVPPPTISTQAGSCMGRCGYPIGYTGPCGCDNYCAATGACCSDYAYMCHNPYLSQYPATYTYYTTQPYRPTQTYQPVYYNGPQYVQYPQQYSVPVSVGRTSYDSSPVYLTRSATVPTSPDCQTNQQACNPQPSSASATLPATSSSAIPLQSGAVLLNAPAGSSSSTTAVIQYNSPIGPAPPSVYVNSPNPYAAQPVRRSGP